MAAKVFHFSKETPPDAMFSDIQTLNKFQDEQFGQLVQFVFDFLTDPGKASRLLSQLDDFATENGVGSGALKNVFKSLLSVPNSAQKKSLTPVQVKEDLINLGLMEGKADYFSEQHNYNIHHDYTYIKSGQKWKTNLVSLSRSALGQTLMVNQLVDMEWKFGVTASSSELDKVGNTFLQLQLAINTGNGIKNSYMELTLPQFYSFLHEMEKAKASLEYLS